MIVVAAWLLAAVPVLQDGSLADRLASRDRFDPQSPAPGCADTNQVNPQIPLPDLGQFNQLLSEGAISHEEACEQLQS